MTATIKRTLGIALAVLLVVGIVLAIFWGRIVGGGSDGVLDPGGSGRVTVVKGVIGSEKKPFFDDPQVKRILRAHGLDVQVTTAGSRQIATSVDLTQYDFAFPSSAPAATKIEKEAGVSTGYAPFYSPMAIATFQPIVKLLADAGNAALIRRVARMMWGWRASSGWRSSSRSSRPAPLRRRCRARNPRPR